eukprot:Gb_19527 [translate_table: standard]
MYNRMMLNMLHQSFLESINQGTPAHSHSIPVKENAIRALYIVTPQIGGMSQQIGSMDINRLSVARHDCNRMMLDHNKVKSLMYNFIMLSVARFRHITWHESQQYNIHSKLILQDVGQSIDSKRLQLGSQQVRGIKHKILPSYEHQQDTTDFLNTPGSFPWHNLEHNGSILE